MSPPGRNDPCPCGSGKKYKRCCLGKPSLDPEAAYQRARQRGDAALRGLVTFAHLSRFEDAHEVAWDRFWEGCEPDEKDEAFAADEIRFDDWFVFNYRLADGRTPLERYLAERGRLLPGEERAILEGWLRTAPGIYQVVEVHPERGALLEDVLRGGQVDVRDVSLSRGVVRWDVLAARVVATAGFHHLCGAAALVSPLRLEPLKAFAERELEAYRCEAPGAGWDELLAERFEHINRFLCQRSLPEVRTPEGAPVCFSKALYDVLDWQAARRALDRTGALHRAADEPEKPGITFYNWLESASRGKLRAAAGSGLTLASEQVSPGRAPKRSLGTVELSADRLVLECMSRERLGRGKRMLGRALAGAVRHRADTFQDLEQAMATRREAPPREQSIEPELERQLVTELYEDYYRDWVNMPLPALDGRTPRQALAEPDGRARVEALLRTFENQAEHLQREGRAAPDVGKLRVALGLEAPPAGPPPGWSQPETAEKLSPEQARALDEATRAALEMLDLLAEDDEATLAGMLVPGELAETVMETFGVRPLVILAGCIEPYKLMRQSQALVKEKQIEVEVERTTKPPTDDMLTVTLSLRLYRQRWRLARLLPVGINQDLGQVTLHHPTIAALVSGDQQFPPRPGAARDEVEATLLASLPDKAFSVLEQANALRLWRDFSRKFQRTATIAPGQHYAWAAAVDYTVRALGTRRGSQQAVAREYGVPASGLARNAKLIETTLGLHQLDPRYTLAGRPGARAMASWRQMLGHDDRLPLHYGRGKGW